MLLHNQSDVRFLNSLTVDCVETVFRSTNHLSPSELLESRREEEKKKKRKRRKEKKNEPLAYTLSRVILPGLSDATVSFLRHASLSPCASCVTDEKADFHVESSLSAVTLAIGISTGERAKIENKSLDYFHAPFSKQSRDLRCFTVARD